MVQPGVCPYFSQRYSGRLASPDIHHGRHHPPARRQVMSAINKGRITDGVLAVRNQPFAVVKKVTFGCSGVNWSASDSSSQLQTPANTPPCPSINYPAIRHRHCSKKFRVQRIRLICQLSHHYEPRGSNEPLTHHILMCTPQIGLNQEGHTYRLQTHRRHAESAPARLRGWQRPQPGQCRREAGLRGGMDQDARGDLPG